MKKKSKKNNKNYLPYPTRVQLSRLRKLNRKDKLSIFLGAGISTSCGLPDLASLNRLLETEIYEHGVHPKKDVNIANQARKLFGKNFNSVVADCLYYKHGVEISDSAISIARSGVKSIVCFNFDEILEEIYRTDGIEHRVVLNGETFNLTNERTVIFHPHGFLRMYDTELNRQRSNLILSKSDYDNLYNDHYCLTNLIQLSMLMTRTVLFVGMSMTDTNTTRLLEEAKKVGVMHWHYSLLKVVDQEDKEIVTNRLRRFGVDPVWYKEHSDIPRIMKKISKCIA